ncbi:hypothetical protein RPMD05_16 [Rhodobacteraceae phage LS06-2018-MD05]|nr:hypothetical protein RPMD05_16 [Rhodobacteraceae phage LS06-2018-MD05]
MKDYSKDINFWKRLKRFAKEVQCNDCCGEEEKEMVINVCNRVISKLKPVVKHNNKTNY